MASKNPFVEALLNRVKNKKYHPRNNDYKTHDVIFFTKNKQQKDKKSAEEMAKVTLSVFHYHVLQ